MVARVANLIIGIWLVIAPWVLGYVDEGARTNDFWLGIAIALIAVAAMKVRGTRWINAGLGAWLIAAPFVLSYATYAPVLNDMSVGLVVLALSLVPTSVRTTVGREERTVV